MDATTLPSMRRQTFKALTSTGAVVLIDRGSQVVLIAVIAHILSPGQIGVIAAAGAAASLVNMLSAFGVHSSFVQAKTVTDRSWAIGRGTLLITTLAMVLLAEALAPLAGLWFRNPDVTAVLRVLAPVMLLNPLTLFAEASLLRRLRARDVAFSEFLASIVSGLLVTLPMALAGFGFWSMAWGSVAHAVTRCFIVTVYAKLPPTVAFSPAEQVRLLRRGLGFMLNSLLSLAVSDAPKWVVGRFLGPSNLGLFSRSMALVGFPGALFGAAVERVAFPAISLLQDERPRLRQGILEAAQLIGIVGAPLTVAIILLAHDIVHGVLGPAWLGAVVPLKVLALATYFRLADRLNWIVLRGVGRPYRLAILQGASLTLMLGGCLVAAPFGLTAVAAAIAAVNIMVYVANTVVAMRAVGIGLQSWLMSLRQGLACAALATAVLWPVGLLLNMWRLPSLAVIAGCGAISMIVGGAALLLAPRVFMGSGGLSLLSALRVRLTVPFRA